jgi:hypothetical protein
MATRMQQRKGTAAQWISTNSGNGPVLNAGEIGYELDTNKFKIGDGVNHWVDLNYFIDAEGALAEITALIDGAPGALNTLNELAAAINDDPAFFTTIATNLSNHQSDTTNIHGIADTSILVTTTGTQTLTNKTITSPAGLVKADVGLGNVDNTSDANKPVSTATQSALDLKANASAITELAQDAVNTAIVAGTGLDKVYDDAANTITLDIDSTVATKTYVDQAEADAITTASADASSKANAAQAAAISTASADATSKANSAQTAAETAAAADATSKANAAKSGAESTAASELSSHSADTTNIHGIADTSILVTTTGTQTLTNKTITSPSGLTKSDVGLSNVDNTSDANKPVSTATQSALDLKANASDIVELSQDAVNTAIIAGTGLDKTYDDVANTITIDIDSTVATKAYADNAVSVAVDNLVAGAPTLLNTLDELAAAMGDDPAYLGTVASNLSALNIDFDGHLGTTTNVHGIADVSALATKTYANDAVSTHNSDTTDVHGISDTAQLATKSYADTAVSNHNADTTNVHGIADTSALETQTGAQSKIDASLSTHNSDTTNVHGIADTSALATKTYADDAVSLAAGTAATALSTHNSDTTNVHGIADTSVLATNASVSDAIDDHNLLTLNVHGIADTTDLTTNGDVDDKISAHNLITENVHGILDTTVLATQDFVASAVSNAEVDQSTLAGTGLDWDANDEQFIIDEQITATRVYTASLLTQATKSNITITGDEHGLTITAENGVGDSNTDALAEGSVNKYFTDERAQDAVGNSVGTGLNYTDSTGEIKVDTTVIQARVANVNDTEIGYLDGVTSGIQSQIDSKLASSTAASTYAPLANPTFTGTVSGVSKSMVGLGNVDNTSDASKPVSTATQTALNLKATIASPDLTGVPTAPTATSGNNTTQIATTAFVSGAVSDLVASAPGALNTLNELAVALGNDANFSTSVTNSIATKAPIASPTFTGTVAGITKSMVGLGNVDNTSDADKPVSSATQTALNLKANAADISELAQDAVNTAIVAGTGLDKVYNDLANTITLDIDSTVVTLSGAQTLTNKTITSPSGLVKADVGLANVDNTSDASKPVSTATQTALDLKAPKADPTFTGTVSGVTKSHVGLGNVDNTSDASKPVSTATQTALDAKASLSGATFTGSVEIDQNLVVDGNLTVNGTAFNASSTSIVIEDNMLQLAHQNAANTVDLGLVVGYNDGANKHSGIVRDVSADKWKLFKGVTTEPSTTVDFTQGSLDALQVAGFEATSIAATSATIGDVSNTELQYLNGVTSAVQTQIDSKAPTANPTFTGTVTLPTGTVTSGMIADGTIANADINASAAIALSKLASGTSGQIIVANASGVPTWVSETGDVTISDTGVTAIASGVIVDADVNASAAIAQSKIANLTTDLAAKAPIASPTFTGSVTLPTGTVTSAMISDGTIVDGDINAAAAIAQSKISGLTSDLAAKAPLASPALTGTPTAPTATAGTNTTQVATTAFVGTAVANLVASAPAALDTLNELASALGNDASFSTTVTTSIATKAPIASPTFTGTATIPTLTLTNPLTAANGGTGLSSLGTGVATFLGTPSSANLAAMITDEIGTGNIVLSEVATTAPAAGSYTLVATDRGKLVEMSGSSANTLTVPLHSTIPYPTGTQIDILQVGSGQTTVAGAAGVTINGTPGLKIRAQWGGATLIKRGENLWVLIGDLTV